jgi:type III secretion protein J
MNRRPLAVVLLLVLAGCRSQIQHGLDERDANELVSVLVARGYDAQKVAEKGKKPTWAVEVDDAHATDAMRVLTELKLPRPRALTTKEVVSQTALIETPGAERLRQLEAQEGDLEQALESMDGVTSAAVELVVPPAARPGQPAQASKAAVLIRAVPEAVVRLGEQKAELRALVAASVDGLKSEDVVLVIDAVVSQVPAPVEPPSSGLRTLVVALGLAVSVLAGLLVALALKLRRKTEIAAPATHATSTAPASQPASPKPTINAAVQKKAA